MRKVRAEQIKVVIAITILVAVGVFIGYMIFGVVATEVAYPDYMTKVESYSDGMVMVDKRTNVMYYRENGMGGITVLLNEGGTPMLWEGEIED